MTGNDAAEVLAIRALGWMAAEEEPLAQFLNATGMSRDQIPALAGDPRFLAAVVDFLLEQDARVIACCDALGERYEALRDARAALPGGRDPHWT